MKIINVFKHFHTVNKHRFLVFKFCCKAGIPFRGLMHDLSKYSLDEFWESAKYYTGKVSPITLSRKENGYSKAWLHHKGRNKHHYEYWIDLKVSDKCCIIPYKYTVEMICDTLSAGKVYMGKDWYPGYQLKYFCNSKDRIFIHESIQKVLIEVYTQVAEKGINKTINKKNLKSIYFKYVNKENN